MRHEKLVVLFGLCCALASTAASITGLVAIVYCVFTDRWLPAIFFLLARRDLVRCLNAAARRVDVRLEAAAREA